VQWALGSSQLVRGLGVAIVLALEAMVRPWVVARLPQAPALLGRTLWLPTAVGRRRIALRDVVNVDVEMRPPPAFEVIVVELRDGGTHDLCPLDWDGAGSLYAALARLTRRTR
jgi:hypothetical protein